MVKPMIPRAFAATPLSLTAALCLEACGDPTPPHARAVDLEGPRGYVSAPGPWLVRASAPAPISAEGLWLEVEVGGGAGGEEPEPAPEPLTRLPLTESGRGDLYLGLIPPAQEGLTVSYTLTDAQGAPLTPPRSFTYEPPPSPPPAPAPCAVRFSAPNLSRPLSVASDTGQAAGIQITIIARYTGAGDALVRLSLGDALYLAAAQRGEAAFVGVTAPVGLSEVRLEAFGEGAARCEAVGELRVE